MILQAGLSMNDAWSGGNKIADGSTWRWSDGSAFVYSNWKQGFFNSSPASQVVGFPINATGNDCISLEAQTVQFMNSDCALSKHYICKFPQNNGGYSST
jgi:hypothetical protein